MIPCLIPNIHREQICNISNLKDQLNYTLCLQFPNTHIADALHSLAVIRQVLCVRVFVCVCVRVFAGDCVCVCTYLFNINQGHVIFKTRVIIKLLRITFEVIYCLCDLNQSIKLDTKQFMVIFKNNKFQYCFVILYRKI